MNYERIISFAESTPWAISREKLRTIEAFLARKARGETIPEAEILAAKSGRKDNSRRQASGIGLIPIYGTITQRADLISEYSGGTSTEVVGRYLDELVADPNVEAIVLDVDSPGGSVFGVEELAQKIQVATRAKKVVAVANSMAASAAYYIASQASELVVTPGGTVGSIGVYMMHVDRSEALRAAGEKVTFIYAGEKKTAGNEYAPLDSTGRDEMQGMVNGWYDQFVRAVARGRKTTQSAVRNGFGRGGMVLAEAAVREGMADRIGTLESTLAGYGYRLGDFFARSLHPEIESRKQKLRMNAEIDRRRKMLEADEQLAARRRLLDR